MADVTGNQINNDGDIRGPAVGGNAGQVGDRWQGASSGQRVEIHHDIPQRRPLDDYTDSELLHRLTVELREVRTALLGDAYNRSNPGLVEMVERVAARQNAAEAEQAHLSRDQIAASALAEERYRKITSQQSAAMVIIWTTLALVGLEGIAILVLFMQRAAIGA